MVLLKTEKKSVDEIRHWDFRNLLYLHLGSVWVWFLDQIDGTSQRKSTQCKDSYFYCQGPLIPCESWYFRYLTWQKSTFFTELLFWQEVHKARKVIPPRTDVAWLMVAEGGEDTGLRSGNAFHDRHTGWLKHQECLHRAQLTLAGAGALSSLLVALWEWWCLKLELGADAARRSDFEAAYHMEDGVVGKLLMVKWVVAQTRVQLWNC